MDDFTFEDIEDDQEKVELDSDQSWKVCFDGLAKEMGVDISFERDWITSTGRWDEHHARIIRDFKGRYWRVFYSKGSTEMQANAPFEHEGGEFNRVYKVPVIKEKFVSSGKLEKDGEEKETVRINGSFIDEREEEE